MRFDEDGFRHDFRHVAWNEVDHLSRMPGAYVVTEEHETAALRYHAVLHVGATADLRDPAHRHQLAVRCRHAKGRKHIFHAAAPPAGAVAFYEGKLMNRWVRNQLQKGRKAFDYQCVLKYLFPDQFGEGLIHAALRERGLLDFGGPSHLVWDGCRLKRTQRPLHRAA